MQQLKWAQMSVNEPKYAQRRLNNLEWAQKSPIEPKWV